MCSIDSEIFKTLQCPEKKIVVIRPFVTVHRNIRFPPDRKDITGFSLATVHAISKTMMHEVELTAKNRSIGKQHNQPRGEKDTYCSL